MELAMERSVDEVMANYAQWKVWFKTTTIEPIGLAHDGENYAFDTADEAADKLEDLRSLGYKVPQDAIVALRAEASAS
jgi:LPS sulfotransferase NodH